MDVRILRYFLAVAREENITRAAESLHIAQPSLSKQLMELEQELGKTLLLRGKRKITLTEEGVLLRKRAEEIIELVDKTEREISADAGQLSGEISIGGIPHPSILEAAAKLRESNPGVSFQFYSNDATDVTERLMHGTLDFTTLLAPVDTSRYEAICLPEHSYWGLLVRADSPMAKASCVHREEIRNLPLIMHRRAGLQQSIAEWAHTRLERLNIAATYNVIYGNPLQLVQSGLGNLLITRDLLTPELGSGVRFLPLDPPLEIHYMLVWKKNATLTKPAERFLAMLKTQ